MSIGEVPRTQSLAVQRYRDWGVYPGPWLWGQKLRILFVIDGTITPERDGFFALGMLTDILEGAFAWWVDIDVTVAKRAPAPFPPQPQDIHIPFSAPYETTYERFRFDQPGFDLYAYDQVWLFGFQPGNDGGPDANIELAENTPLTDAELKVLAEWMDAGGGVFATGDHAYLGSSMCYRIPRVRTMRKWTAAQGVPPREGSTRFDTNQPVNLAERINLSYMDFDHQGDAVPQPIEVVMEPISDGISWFGESAPHPILCARAGVIDRFPDHPHEGEVIADADVSLDSPVLIQGYAKSEYPGGRRRPTPKVIAYGRTTNAQWNREKHAVDARRFGLVGVYDGEAVGIGRVVVDSTWHHWMSENLIGFEADNPSMLTLMAAYYRNVALWLATPEQRMGMLTAATWGVLMGAGQMQFPPGASIWELGGRARDVIGRTASQCTVRMWTNVVLDSTAFRSIEPPEPCLTCPPWEVFEHAMLGGIAKQMLEIAFPYQKQVAIGERPVPDPDAIAGAVREGVRLGHRELVRSLEEGAGTVSKIADAAPKAFRETPVPSLDLGVTTVRVRVEQIRFADPFDPALAEGSATLHLRLNLDGQTVTRATLDLDVPEFDSRGQTVRLEADLGEATVWVGSELAVIVAGRSARAPSATQDVRGSLTLTGDPRTWPGVHRSSVDSPGQWRLQIRIDEATAESA